MAVRILIPVRLAPGAIRTVNGKKAPARPARKKKASPLWYIMEMATARPSLLLPISYRLRQLTMTTTTANDYQLPIRDTYEYEYSTSEGLFKVNKLINLSFNAVTLLYSYDLQLLIIKLSNNYRLTWKTKYQIHL